METVKGISEEECYKAIGPGVSAKDVQNLEVGTRETDPSKKLKLEVCLGVQFTLDVVLENQHGEFGVMTLEGQT